MKLIYKENHGDNWIEYGVTMFFSQFRWTYADPSWACIAALVPVFVSCAEAGDEVANKILLDSVQELASSVKAVIQRLGLCGEGVVVSNWNWNIQKNLFFSFLFIPCLFHHILGMRFNILKLFTIQHLQLSLPPKVIWFIYLNGGVYRQKL